MTRYRLPCRWRGQFYSLALDQQYPSSGTVGCTPRITLMTTMRRQRPLNILQKVRGCPILLIALSQTFYSGFSWTFWRNSLILSLAAIGFWKFAPAPHEDVYLTRWIAMYGTPVEEWLRRNTKHLVLAQEESEGMKLLADARMPPMRRYRYPQ